MYLPAIKPFWFSWITLLKTDLILLAITPDKILYVTLSRDMGRQFLRYSLGLFPLGKIDIIPSFCDSESFPFPKVSLKDLKMKSPTSIQKNLKNSAEKPSVPGDLLFLVFFRTSRTSHFE